MKVILLRDPILTQTLQVEFSTALPVASCCCDCHRVWVGVPSAIPIFAPRIIRGGSLPPPGGLPRFRALSLPFLVCVWGGWVSFVAYRAQLGRVGGSRWGWVLQIQIPCHTIQCSLPHTMHLPAGLPSVERDGADREMHREVCHNCM